MPDDRHARAHLAERRAPHLIIVAWSHYLRRRNEEEIEALDEAKI